MKKIPYHQMTIELDKLMFGVSLPALEETKNRAEVIEAYLTSCGWSWDEILEEICNETTLQLQSGACN